MHYELIITVLVVIVASVLISPKSRSNESFFSGKSEDGQQPRLLTLIFSQVTTWIFARSLMTAAVLGYYYGIWGALAYAAYYLSFVTGGFIIDHLRFRLGYENLQGLLATNFGRAGTACFNFVIALRLISEVFANLLVVGLIFGAVGTGGNIWAIIGLALFTLIYSMLGGLRGSLRTDVLQFILFAVTLVVVLVALFVNPIVGFGDLFQKPFNAFEPGPVLILVALLQVWSYPAHDPVMIDRGFLADRKTTWLSFMHAFWISALCILAFGGIGIVAGQHAAEGEVMTVTIERLLGAIPMFFFNVCLIVSAMSTMDSTLASASKLMVKDMNILKPTVTNGRVVMALFMVAGVIFVFIGGEDLYKAVAVSGTASMFLAPVVFFNIWGKVKRVPTAAYLLGFILSIAGAILYFTESGKMTDWLGDAHKYTKLLWICLVILIVSSLAFALGSLMNKKPDHAIQKE